MGAGFLCYHPAMPRAEIIKWLAGIAGALILAWMVAVVDAMIDATRLEGKVWEYERRLSVAEAEIINLRARVRHLEQGGAFRAPEE